MSAFVAEFVVDALVVGPVGLDMSAEACERKNGSGSAYSRLCLTSMSFQTTLTVGLE
jgi:hypothetical protein